MRTHSTKGHRFSELSRDKSDEELRELASDFADLTEIAQHVLRNEMRKRGKGDPAAHPAAKNLEVIPSTESNPEATIHLEPQSPEDDSEVDQQNTDQPHEYTWKTLLCECDDQQEAWQLSEVLRRAGIESWIDGPGRSYSIYSQLDNRNTRVLVAADQLDRARSIAAQPIPQEIVELSKIDPPAYEPPTCPQCGAKDPVLQAVDPTNSWICESCESNGPIRRMRSRNPPKRPPHKSFKTERAARQRGSSILRENSSNGGKTIRTFWLHSRSGG